MTQEQLTKVSGVSPRTIQRYECGTSRPRLDAAEKLAKALNISVDQLLGTDGMLVAQCGTRDPLRIARDLGIEVMYYPFNEQRGAYKVFMRNRFIFVKNDLHPVMENIVLLHELGHDALHREEATKVGGLQRV